MAESIASTVVEKEKKVLFSVVIPTYNRPQRLLQCLEALTRQTLGRNIWEVIVVDDGSIEPVESFLKNIKDHLPIRLIRQANAGPATARNTGVSQALGQYVLFTDDDCSPLPHWLAELDCQVKQNPESLIGGSTINTLCQNVYSEASQLLIDYLYEYYNQKSGRAVFFTSNNFAVPKDIYERIGGFDTSFPLAAGEDREFCDRWKHHGLIMHYAPNMQVLHAHDLNFGSFCRQHFNYGRGAFHFHAVRSQRQSNKISVEPFKFYMQLLLYPFSKRQGLLAILMAALFFVSQASNVIGFFAEKYSSSKVSRGKS